MPTRYSRLAKIEESKNRKKAIIYIIFSSIALVILVLYGIPTIARLSSLVSNFKDSDSPITNDDNTPPAPPFLQPIPEYTNLLNLEIKGTTESGASVIFNVNGTEREVLANASGAFIYKAALNEGENVISVYAKDTSGNVSQKSDSQKVILDVKPPDISINSPSDGSSYYGSRQKLAVIEGTTEPGAKVIVNNRNVLVEDSGKFSYSTNLGVGENGFEFIAQDKAGNQSIARITLYYWD